MNIIIASYFDCLTSFYLENFNEIINELAEYSSKSVEFMDAKKLDKSILKYYRLEKFPFNEQVKIDSLFESVKVVRKTTMTRFRKLFIYIRNWQLPAEILKSLK